MPSMKSPERKATMSNGYVLVDPSGHFYVGKVTADSPLAALAEVETPCLVENVNQAIRFDSFEAAKVAARTIRGTWIGSVGVLPLLTPTTIPEQASLDL